MGVIEMGVSRRDIFDDHVIVIGSGWTGNEGNYVVGRIMMVDFMSY